jgi:beta-mannosidase
MSAALNFRDAIFKMRSGKWDAKSATLRKFNDTWPSISASRVDFYGKKKALSYECRRVFAPVIATVEIDGGLVNYSVSCLSQKPYSGKLTFALYDCNDRCLAEATRTVYAEAMSATLIESVDYSKYVSGELEKYYVIFELFNERVTDYVGCKTFAPPKHFEFRNPEIKYNVTGSGREFEISLLSAAYAMGVQIDFGDIEVELSDNFIDLREGVAEKLTARTDRVISPEKLQRALKLRSVYDIGKYKSK